MRAPAFWWDLRSTLPARLLAPAAALYGGITARRMQRPGMQAGCPVVCVGNFTAGGAGKTPTAIAIAALLRDGGWRPAFLSRGYGGRLLGPVRVDPAVHDAADVGDEPLLLARHAETVIAQDRPAGATLCVDLGADLVIMDDGLQNPSLVKDLRIVVVDGTTGIGNGRALPAGPLRAPLAIQWTHADALVLIGRGEAGSRVAEAAAARGLPVLRAALAPDPTAAADLAGRRVLAFAGIGRPEKFFETLRSLGAEVVTAVGFPDHHAFTTAERARLVAEAETRRLTLVTTEKDAARLTRVQDRLTERMTALPVRLAFAEGDEARDLLVRRLGSPQPR